VVLPRSEPRRGPRLLRLLPLHPGPDVTLTAAAVVAGAAPEDVRPLLAELTRAHLLTECAPGRYSCHDLLRTYAMERSAPRTAPAGRDAVIHRVLDHFLHTAHAAGRRFSPWLDARVLSPRRGRRRGPGVHGRGGGTELVHSRAAGAARSLRHWRHSTGPRHPCVAVRLDVGAILRPAGPLAPIRHTCSVRDSTPRSARVTVRRRRICTVHSPEPAPGSNGTTTPEVHIQLSLNLCTDLDDRLGLAHALRCQGWLLDRLGRHERSARLGRASPAPVSGPWVNGPRGQRPARPGLHTCPAGRPPPGRRPLRGESCQRSTDRGTTGTPRPHLGQPRRRASPPWRTRKSHDLLSARAAALPRGRRHLQRGRDSAALGETYLAAGDPAPPAPSGNARRGSSPVPTPRRRTRSIHSCTRWTAPGPCNASLRYPSLRRRTPRPGTPLSPASRASRTGAHAVAVARRP
jgi:hypothetical protein